MDLMMAAEVYKMLNARLPKSLIDELRERARLERRSITAIIEVALRNYLRGEPQIPPGG